MAQVRLRRRVPKTFKEAFHHIHAKLVEHVNVSSSFVRQLMNSGLLNRAQAEKLEVYEQLFYYLRCMR